VGSSYRRSRSEFGVVIESRGRRARRFWRDRELAVISVASKESELRS